MCKVSIKNISVILFLVAVFGHCASKELKTVEKVDLQKYSGLWYEIASKPVFAQKGCRCTTARYTPLSEEKIKVYNRCLKGDNVSDISGSAWPVEGSHNAKLKVRFFWPFAADYYIVALADDYSVALVGNPGRKTMWLLARKPELPRDIMNEYLTIAEKQGYDLAGLQYTEHKNCNGN